MITATKEFKWEMAHMLTGHEGLCRNVHGHSYKMQIEVSRASGTIADGSSAGMVLDFSHIKQIVEDNLIHRLDHAFMVDGTAQGLENELLHLLQGRAKLYIVSYRPTAENMAKDFFETIQGYIDREYKGEVTLESVRIWETVTAYAEYRK